MSEVPLYRSLSFAIPFTISVVSSICIRPSSPSTCEQARLLSFAIVLLWFATFYSRVLSFVTFCYRLPAFAESDLPPPANKHVYYRLPPSTEQGALRPEKISIPSAV